MSKSSIRRIRLLNLSITVRILLNPSWPGVIAFSRARIKSIMIVLKGRVRVIIGYIVL